MAVTELPRDVRSLPIPALRPMIGGAHQVAITATTNRNTVEFNTVTKVIGVYSTQDLYVEIGPNIVTAAVTDHFIPASTYFMFSIMLGDTPFTNIAGIRATADGTLYVSEFQ